ncbi:tyrosine--tRNA ligase [Patescibacteria group bacterium]|nr:tyrosine--tRNA ligase [Patescibacteria group bacterium]
MPKVLKDEKLIEKFLTRGVETIIPSPEALKEKLMSGERIKAYSGFDPTGPYLHIGHAMGIRALRILQQLGHEVIFLVGDFTAIAGDPSDGKHRKIMTEEDILKNMEGWQKQASQLIDFEGDNPAYFKRNSEWLSKLSLKDIIDLMSKTTVQQMLERDLFQRKLKELTPIGLQEFIYPLMQGYDSVAMEVDLEIGGNDQIFNMLMGRSLSRVMINKEKFVRGHELMEAPDAITMSKTKGNGINLNDSPEDIYGKAMSYPDELILKGLRLLTDMPLEEIWEIQEKIKTEENPMKYKKIMAYEITKMIKGDKEAKNAEEFFEKTVQNKDITSEATTKTDVNGTLQIIEFLKKVDNEENSLSNIRRIIEQGGVEIDGNKITDPFLVVDFKEGTIVKFGKRKFYEVNK